jgi:hypothetical protein
MSEPATTRPQRLYHFTATTFALDDIQNSRLKIAQIADLNDPFELRCMDTSGRNMRWAYDAWREECSERFGVLCFTEIWNDILQWSHYADRHRGICLGFDVTGEPGKFGKVTYVSEKEQPLEKPDQAFVWHALATKLKVWEYEHEWRVFTTLEDGIWNDRAGRKLYFVDFGEELVLKHIILGFSNTTSTKEIFDLANKDVRISRVHLADLTFDLELIDCVRM